MSGFLRAHADKWPSDPTKVADIVLKISETEDPPVRLLVGPETVEYAAQVAEALAASDRDHTM